MYRSLLKNIALLLFACSFICTESANAQIDTDQVVKIGQNALFFKDYVLAIQYFNTAIRTSPEQAEPYFYRALAKYNLDDYYGTEVDVDSCLTRNPFIYRAYFLRGLARQSMGKDSLALEDYRKVLADNPDDQGALHNSAVLYLADNDTTATKKTLDRLLRFYPKYAAGYVIKGGYELSRKDTVAAVQLIEKALEIDNESVGAHITLASIAYDREEYEEAKRHIDEALTYQGDDAALYTNRGIINFQLNDLRGAMADYSKAIDLKSNYVIALYNRALLRSRVGNNKGALEDFDAVLMNDPTNYFALFNRALIQNDLGLYRQAKADLDVIIDRYPTFLPAYMQRAVAKRFSGDAKGADMDLYHATRLLNDPKARQELIAKGEQDQKGDHIDDEAETKTTRDEKDQNIRKFRMLVYNNRQDAYRNIYRGEDNSIRGRIQDRDIQIVPEPLYAISYYTDLNKEGQELPASELAALNCPSTIYQLQLVRYTPSLTQQMIDDHQQRLVALEKEQPTIPVLFSLAMNQMTLRTHDEAIATWSRIIEMDSTIAAAYMQRAIAQVDLILSDINADKLKQENNNRVKVGHDPLLSPSVGYDVSSEGFKLKVKMNKPIEDLKKVLNLQPGYAPALYNMGCLYFRMGRYEESIEAFTEALKSSPRMGSAYFNRGLCYYAIGEKQLADHDMSQAGNLGLYKAYGIIKRMQ